MKSYRYEALGLRNHWDAKPQGCETLVFHDTNKKEKLEAWGWKIYVLEELGDKIKHEDEKDTWYEGIIIGTHKGKANEMV